MKRMLFVMSLLSVCVPSLNAADSDISPRRAFELLLDRVVYHVQKNGSYLLGIMQEGDRYYFQDTIKGKGEDITSLCSTLKEADREEMYETVSIVKEMVEKEAPNVIRVLFAVIMPLSDEQIRVMAALNVLRDVLRLLNGEDLSIKEDRCSERSSRSSLLKKSEDRWLTDKRRTHDTHAKSESAKQSSTSEPAHDTSESNQGRKDIYEYIISVDGPLNPFEW